MTVHISTAPVQAPADTSNENVIEKQWLEAAIAAEATDSTDPCYQATSVGSTGALLDYDVVRACLDADFPFPYDHKYSVATTIMKTLQAGYVFEDIAANPPSTSPPSVAAGLSLIPVSLAAKVDELSEDEGSTWRQFHDGISDTFTKARDAHLMYEATCFRQFTFTQPIFLGRAAVQEGGEPIILVLAVNNEYGQLANTVFNPSGCEVVTIDGLPAAEYIQQWADEKEATSKDANSRFNAALSSPHFKPYSDGNISSGSMMIRRSLPPTPSIKYGFRCSGVSQPQVVDVKWGITYNGLKGVLDVPQYYAAYCEDPSYAHQQSRTMAASPVENAQNENESQEKGEREAQSDEELVREVQSTPWESLSDDVRERAIEKVMKEFKEMPEWLAKGTQEIVLGPEADSASKVEWTEDADEKVLRERAERILRELPAIEPVPEIPLFEQQRSFTKMKDAPEFDAAAGEYRVLVSSQSGLFAILLDDNETGVITIPTFAPFASDLTGFAKYYATLIQAIRTLKPLAKRLIIDVSYNTGGSPCLAHRFVEAFFPTVEETVTSIRYSPVERELIAIGMGDYEYFETVASSTYDEATAPYIQKVVRHPNRQYRFTNYVQDGCTAFRSDPTRPSQPWDPKNIVIVSDGSCGSSCAIFANQMTQKGGVYSVAVGGHNMDPMSFSTFPGGQVFTAENRYFRRYRALQALFGGAPVEQRSELITKASDQQQSQQQEKQPQQQEQQKQHKQKPLDKRAEASIVEVAPPLRENSDQALMQADFLITKPQRDSLLRVLPEPFQHQAVMTFTWRQTYNTGTVKEQFVQNANGQWIPNWGPDVGQWTEYSFLPATHRIKYKVDHYMRAHTIWKDARDAVW
ncbi:hypothetical protein BGZ73_002085 [Actinomortierella ambigua]|nr:hypothetical protein BGZ73_002085 [Actinomortierella ambigua]